MEAASCTASHQMCNSTVIQPESFSTLSDDWKMPRKYSHLSDTILGPLLDELDWIVGCTGFGVDTFGLSGEDESQAPVAIPQRAWHKIDRSLLLCALQQSVESKW
jgi:hypothetical protein